jgi:hypothetical protein
MQINKVNVSSLPNQTAKVQVQFDGKKQFYIIEVGYREICGYWVMTIKDEYQNVLLANFPLLTGGSLYEAGNLLKQFGYLNLGSIIIAKAKQTENDYPSQEELGTNFILCWGDTEVG